MVVGARNPAGVSCAQRPSCRLSQAFRFHYTIQMVYYLWYCCDVPFMRTEMGKRYGKSAT